MDVIKVYKYIDSEYIEIPNIEVGPTFSEELSSVLDGCVLKYLSETNEILHPEVSVKVEIICDDYTGNNVKYYIVQSDQCESLARIDGLYEHVLCLVEPTAYLEKVPMPNQAFTTLEDENKTMYDVCQNALLNAEIVYNDENPRFYLTGTKVNELMKIPAEDFFFTTPTLKEVLDALFSTIHCRCKVISLEDINSISITAYDINHRGKEIPIPNDEQRTYEKKYLDSNEFAQSLEVSVSNAISKNVVIVHGWDTVKVSDGKTYTADNAVLDVKYPIYELKSVKIRCKLWSLTPNLETSLPSYEDLGLNAVDLTNCIVEKQIYDLLTFEEKKQYLYYEIGSRFININLTYQDALGFEHYVLENIINNLRFSTLKNGPLADIDNAISNIRFKVEFLSYPSFRASLTKLGIQNRTTIIDSQSEQNVNPERYGLMLKNKINQTGNIQFSRDVVVDNYSKILKLGDYLINNYVLSSRDFQAVYDISTNKILWKVRYEFTQNFNNSLIKSTIDRTKKLYNIPLENISRENLFKNYLILSSGAFGYNETTSRILNTNGLQLLISQMISPYVDEDSSSSYKLKNVYFKTDEMNKYNELSSNNVYYILTPMCFYFGNSLIFRFETLDNYSVGYGIGKRILGGRKTTYNPYVSPTTGRYSEGEIILALGTSNLDESDSQYIEKLRALPLGDISYSTTDELLSDSFKYKTYKDPYISDKFNIQIEVIPNKNDQHLIVIGDAIMKYHGFLGKGVKLYLYLSADEKYLLNDKKCKGIKQDKDINEYFSIGVNSIKLLIDNFKLNYKSWAIGTEDGELVLGVNTITSILYSLVNKL